MGSSTAERHDRLSQTPFPDQERQKPRVQETRLGVLRSAAGRYGLKWVRNLVGTHIQSAITGQWANHNVLRYIGATLTKLIPVIFTRGRITFLVNRYNH